LEKRKKLMKEKFEFNQDLQKKIVAMMLFDNEFLNSHREQIEPNYFDNPILKDLSKVVIDFHGKYGRIPSLDEFLQELDSLITEKKKRQRDYPFEECLSVATEIMNVGKKGSFDYVRDKVGDFARQQVAKRVILSVDEKRLDERDYLEDIAYKLKEAAMAGSGDEPVGLKTINCGDVEPENITWLWRDRIPEGKLTFIIGDPGVGKSFLTADLAKHVTTGEGWPDTPYGSVEKGSVLLLNAEDGLADTIVRRLEWAGANRKKVVFIEATIERTGEERIFRLDKDLSRLENLIKAKGDVRLVIFDPLSAYLGDVDSYRDTEVRGMLTPVVLLAEKYKVAILAVLHMNKKQSQNAIYRVPGSIGFAGAARAIWYVSNDGETEGRKLFSGMKSNLSARDIRDLGLAFQLKEGKVIWEEVPMRKTTQEILRAQEDEGKRKPIELAMEFLRETLKDGAVAQSEINDMVDEEDFGWSTVKKAKKRLGIVSDRDGYGKGSKVYWSLPEKKEEEK
jgi:putative DNA primase/helicase